MLGRDALFATLLNRCQPVLEGVHIAWRSVSAFDSTFAWNACHSCPEIGMIFVYSIGDMFVCSLVKTFGHLSDRWKNPKRYKALTMEHYIRNKVFVSPFSTAFRPLRPLQPWLFHQAQTQIDNSPNPAI